MRVKNKYDLKKEARRKPQDPVHRCRECKKIVRTEEIARIGKCPYCGSIYFLEIRWLNLRQVLWIWSMGPAGRAMISEFDYLGIQRLKNRLSRIAEACRAWDLA